MLGWHTGIASGGYVFANILIGLLALNYDTYTPRPFHGTLIIIAVTLLCMLFNTFLAKRLPLVEGVILVFHVFGFFAIVIPLWVLAPRFSASEAFGLVQDNGGWGNKGLACLVGLVGPVFALIGKSIGRLEKSQN